MILEYVIPGIIIYLTIGLFSYVSTMIFTMAYVYRLRFNPFSNDDLRKLGHLIWAWPAGIYVFFK